MTSDTELVLRARRGDAGAFDALIGPHIEPAWRFAATILRDREEARDVVQEAALKAFRKLGQLRDGSPMRPWFFAIVSNQCRTLRRTRWWSVVHLGEPPGQSAGPEDAAVRILDVRHAVARLGRDDRMALYLFYYLDLPQDEIAQIMGTSTAAVKTRLHRAVRRLRPALEVEETPA
jgi:RNA polymerase sigma-70 factor (ECF subfamily)